MSGRDISVTCVDGFSGLYSVRTDAHVLNFLHGRGELTVRDTDLAEFLGYKQARDIRKLIDRLWSGDGNGDDRAVLPRSERPNSRATMARQSTGNGASRMYAVDEYWLTREQALIVAARSDTQRGLAVLESIVRMFLAILDSMKPRPEPRRIAAPLAAIQDPWLVHVVAWLSQQPPSVLQAGLRPDEVHYEVFGVNPTDSDGSSLARIAKILRHVGFSRDRFYVVDHARLQAVLRRVA